MRAAFQIAGTGCLALAFAVLPAQASAQAGFGVSGGVVSSSFYGDDTEDFEDSNTGFNAGAFFALPLTEMLSIVPGVYYVQKGGSGSIQEQGFDFDVDLDLTYLEIPVLASLSVTPDRAFDVSLFAGPTLAWEIGCELNAEAEGVQENAACDEEGVEGIDTRTLDVGAMFGAGVGIPVSERMSFLVQGGLDLGLRSIDDSADNIDVKNQAYFLNVGLSWMR